MEEKIIDMIAKISENEEVRNHPDIDLLDNDILDSLGFITLISSLEEEFNIELQPTQIPPDTWRKVSSIAALIDGYQ